MIPVGWALDYTTASQGDTLYVLVGGGVMGGFAALHYWFPKLGGRLLGEGVGKVALVLMTIGIHLYVIPMFFAGLEGQPVDVFKFYEDTGLDGYNLVASIGAFILVDRDPARARQRRLQLAQRAARPRPRPVGRDDARVVRALAAAAAQLRRGPRRAQPRAAARHPRVDRRGASGRSRPRRRSSRSPSPAARARARGAAAELGARPERGPDSDDGDSAPVA